MNEKRKETTQQIIILIAKRLEFINNTICRTTEMLCDVSSYLKKKQNKIIPKAFFEKMSTEENPLIWDKTDPT